MSLIVAAYDEEDVIAAKGRERARARLPARAARDHRRLRRLAPTRTAELRRARGGRRPRARAPARRQGARPGRRGRARRAASCWRSPTRTRSGSPTRCARWSRRSPTRASATSAARSVRQRGGTNQEGAVLALRDVAARARVGARVGHRPATARSTRSAARPTCDVDPRDGPRPLVPVQHRQARLPRRLRAGGAGDGEDGARRSRASGGASGG